MRLPNVSMVVRARWEYHRCLFEVMGQLYEPEIWQLGYVGIQEVRKITGVRPHPEVRPHPGVCLRPGVRPGW